ncbi:MAG: hypothetical protein LBB18_00885 [Puniceicoccales bacterium]|nr:hypothetical protein [Puniceicoccales bacterium]
MEKDVFLEPRVPDMRVSTPTGSQFDTLRSVSGQELNSKDATAGEKLLDAHAISERIGDNTIDGVDYGNIVTISSEKEARDEVEKALKSEENDEWFKDAKLAKADELRLTAAAEWFEKNGKIMDAINVYDHIDTARWQPTVAKANSFNLLKDDILFREERIGRLKSFAKNNPDIAAAVNDRIVSERAGIDEIKKLIVILKAHWHI